MNRSIIFNLVLLAATLLSGCSGLRVTVYSDPPLATIYQGSQKMGVAPVELSYKLSEEQIRAGSASVSGLTARWVSGATAEINSLNLSLANGKAQQFTFVRPQSYPGVEMDVQYVSEYRRAFMNALPALLLLQQQQPPPQIPTVPAYRPPPAYNTYCTRDSFGNSNCTTRQQ